MMRRELKVPDVKKNQSNINEIFNVILHISLCNTYKPTALTAIVVLYVLFIKYSDHFLYKTGINV